MLSSVLNEARQTFVDRKEKEIRLAIEHYYKGQEWDWSSVFEVCETVIDDDGLETFYINDTPMVRLCPPKIQTLDKHSRTVVSIVRYIRRIYEGEE